MNFLYPANWRALAAEIKAANHHICQECGRKCRRPGEFYLGWEYELTVAHYDNVYEADAVLLSVLCARCHLRHDAPFVWSARRRADRQRRRQAGQMELLTQTSAATTV